MMLRFRDFFARTHRFSPAECALAGAALLFSLGIAAELCLLDKARPFAFRLGAMAAPARVAGSAPPAPALAAWAASALARPLFSAARTPYTAPLAAPPPFPMRLAGTMIIPGARLAIFSAPDGSPHVARAGAALGAFRIAEIGANSVRLIGPNGVQTLHLDFTAFTPGPITVAAAGAPGFPGSNAWPIQRVAQP